jgi:hypothetical protein
MADILSAAIKTSVSWTRTEDTALGARTDKKLLSTAIRLEDGSDNGQANKVFHDTRTIAANSVDTINLSSMTQQMFTTAVPSSMTVVRAFRVLNRSTTVGAAINLGASATSPFSSYAVRIGSGSEAVISNWQEGWAVAPEPVLRVSNPNSSSATYEIVIIGS